MMLTLVVLVEMAVGSCDAVVVFAALLVVFEVV
jgi:hypothetical protein